MFYNLFVAKRRIHCQRQCALKTDDSDVYDGAKRKMSTPKSLCQAAIRFFERCKEKRISTTNVLAELKKWCEGRPDKTSSYRNIRAFLTDGQRTGLGPTAREPFLEFCHHLGIEFEPDEFDGHGLRVDYLHRFREENSDRGGMLDSLCGEYWLFRPELKSNGLIKVVNNAMQTFTLRIERENRSGFYKFNFWNPRTHNHWAGPVLCRDRFLHLVGFDQTQSFDVVTMILTEKKVQPGGQSPPCGTVLIGGVFMRSECEFGDPQPHDVVIGRATALAKCDKRQERSKKEALLWLSEMQDRTTPLQRDDAINMVGFAADVGASGRRREN